MAGERRYFGFGQEAAFGQEQTNMAGYLDFLRTDLDVPNSSPIVYEGAGRAPTAVIPGPYIPRGTIEAGVDENVWPWLLYFLCGAFKQEGTAVSGGGDTTLDGTAAAGQKVVPLTATTNFNIDDWVTIGYQENGQIASVQDGVSITLKENLIKTHLSGAVCKEITAPFIHKFMPSAGLALPSFTARIGRQVTEHRFLGCNIQEATFSAERGFLNAALTILAQKDAKASIDLAGKSMPEALFGFREAYVLFGTGDGSNRTALHTRASITYRNEIDEDGAIRFGSRFPVGYSLGGVEITGQFTLAFDDTSEYERFWGGAGGPQEDVVGAARIELGFNAGPSRFLSITIDNATWIRVGAPVSGRDRIYQTVDVRAIDYSGTAVLFVVRNNIGRYAFIS